MDKRNLSGFRVCTKILIGDNADSRKYYIFINEGWLKIKNVQDHIKNIFNINGEVNIYIGDVLLPENETIKLIQPHDILISKTVEAKKEDFYSKQCKLCPTDFTDLNVLPAVSSLPNQQKSEMILVPSSVGSSEKILSDCFEELRSKKEQIAKKSAHDADSASTVNDSMELEALYTIPPKKRKRKHKKKSKVSSSPSFVEENLNTSDLMAFDSLSSLSKHIHFSDVENKEKVHAHSSPKVNGNTYEGIRSSLLNLVNKPASQKIFARKSESTFTTMPESKDFEVNTLESTPVKLDENKCELNDSEKFVPKVGDLISFKKIKLGNDYTPQESNEITGEVLTIEGTAGSYLVVFTIKEGAEEFEDPSGKFSIEVDENRLEGDKINIAEMKWNDVLEPRLKRRVQL